MIRVPVYAVDYGKKVHHFHFMLLTEGGRQRGLRRKTNSVLDMDAALGTAVHIRVRTRTAEKKNNSWPLRVF